MSRSSDQPNFSSPPPSHPFYLLSFPTQHILLVTFNNPKGLNCINTAAHRALDDLFTWYDNEPSLRCAIVTGTGRAFCAGADLKEWNSDNQGSSNNRGPGMPASGFGGLSRRTGKKVVIGAINGLAFGGGMEIVVNLDLVVASKSAVFGLPEVKRGVVAVAGALPRITRIMGKQRAMEMALTGRNYSAEQGLTWGWVNVVAPDHDGANTPVEKRPVTVKAVELAKEICANSPDSVIVSRAGVASSWEDGSVEHATTTQAQIWGSRMSSGDNLKEGVLAFVQKRKPKWNDSKL